MSTTPVYRHVFHGWDHSNMEWYHTAWPKWSVEPVCPEGMSHPQWKFDWKRKSGESMTVDPEVVATHSTPIKDGPTHSVDRKGKGKAQEL
jgi:hypothetical protein